MTAFRPGQSPPPVNMPMRIVASLFNLSCRESVPRASLRMDQPTPDPAPTPDHAAEADREDRVAHRLQARIETTEPLIAWTRGWVSREMRMHGVFAARTLDFGVLTDRWLYLLNTGFFTRRPRRCVYGARLAELS